MITTESGGNDDDSDSGVWEWIAIDSSIAIISIIGIGVCGCFGIMYYRRRQKKKTEDNYILLQSTVQYYQD